MCTNLNNSILERKSITTITTPPSMPSSTTPVTTTTTPVLTEVTPQLPLTISQFASSSSTVAPTTVFNEAQENMTEADNIFYDESEKFYESNNVALNDTKLKSNKSSTLTVIDTEPVQAPLQSNQVINLETIKDYIFIICLPLMTILMMAIFVMVLITRHERNIRDGETLFCNIHKKTKMSTEL